jgi:hypothetical protein
MKTVGSEPQEDTNVSDEGRYQQSSSTLASAGKPWPYAASLPCCSASWFSSGLVLAVLAVLFGVYVPF